VADSGDRVRVNAEVGDPLGGYAGEVTIDVGRRADADKHTGGALNRRGREPQRRLAHHRVDAGGVLDARDRDTIALDGVESRCGPEARLPSVPNAASRPPPLRASKLPTTARAPPGRSRLRVRIDCCLEEVMFLPFM
jgi:hypothetical protein